MSSIGAEAEEAVASQFATEGYSILARNWTNNKAELDVIAQHPRTKRIHIIEVKYRRSADHGGGVAAINRQKQQQLIRGALWWLQQQGLSDELWQIDVADVSGPRDKLQINVIANAITV